MTIAWKHKPNFFIVGAPKCGTTSMHRYLRQHPDIYMPAEKEMHYFGTDLAFQNLYHQSETEYARLFDKWGGQSACGEASVWYLYSKNSAAEIHAFDPNAKIIVMLRNPADMVHAQHAQAMYVGRETITDFREALAAEDRRRNGEQVSSTSPTSLYFYSRIARYTEQLQRYVDVFGRDQIHIVVFDDLRSNVEEVYAGVLEFLNVDETYRANLLPQNKNRRYRWKHLHYLVNNPAPSLKHFVKTITPERIWKPCKRALQAINTKTAKRDPMPVEVREMLNDIYRDEVAQISEFLSRDLSHWSAVE